MKLINVVSPHLNVSDLSVLCQQHDAILLRQDGVYLCLRDNIRWPTVQLYALDVDVQARQIAIPPTYSVIDAQRWVELSAAAQVNVLWQN